jgi:hypothetical protein
MPIAQVDRPGVLAINAGATARDLDAPLRGHRYTLSATQPDSSANQLNGHTLDSGSDGGLPARTGTPIGAGHIPLPPATIPFVAFPWPETRLTGDEYV